MLIIFYRLQVILVVVFFFVVFAVVSKSPLMFLKRHGRYHALLGLFHLSWLVIGFIQVNNFLIISHQVYDTILGISGVLLAVTAAMEFQHKSVVNSASGTLDAHATVTYSEMIEHSFYQGLNIAQITLIHFLSSDYSFQTRVLSLILVTSPWLIRSQFPVNKFSDNYVKVDEKSDNIIRFMYRIKKYQYVFYKHYLLHGLNVCIVLDNVLHLGGQVDFRMYWMLLNTSYVMEFFLQTLVKKKYMSQSLMLGLQVILMAAASVSALHVLQYVRHEVALFSGLLNFVNRKQDLLNTMVVVAAASVLQLYWS